MFCNIGTSYNKSFRLWKVARKGEGLTIAHTKTRIVPGQLTTKNSKLIFSLSLSHGANGCWSWKLDAWCTSRWFCTFANPTGHNLNLPKAIAFLHSVCIFQTDDPAAARLVGRVLPHGLDTTLEERVVATVAKFARILNVVQRRPKVLNCIERVHLQEVVRHYQVKIFMLTN